MTEVSFTPSFQYNNTPFTYMTPAQNPFMSCGYSMPPINFSYCSPMHQGASSNGLSAASNMYNLCMSGYNNWLNYIPSMNLSMPAFPNIFSGISNFASNTFSAVGDFASRFISNARKYLGYKESDGSYKTFTGGKSEKWCADFVSYVARESGISGFNFSSVQGILDWGRSKGRFSTTPKVGDVIIFKNGGRSHTGIVTSIENGRVHTIEGNTTNRVGNRDYALNDRTITGYVSLA